MLHESDALQNSYESPPGRVLLPLWFAAIPRERKNLTSGPRIPTNTTRGCRSDLQELAPVRETEMKLILGDISSGVQESRSSRGKGHSGQTRGKSFERFEISVYFFWATRAQFLVERVLNVSFFFFEWDKDRLLVTFLRSECSAVPQGDRSCSINEAISRLFISLVFSV